MLALNSLQIWWVRLKTSEMERELHKIVDAHWKNFSTASQVTEYSAFVT